MFLAEAANPLNASELIFPTLEVIHIAGFAVLVGTIAIVDFRLLGLGLLRQKAAEVARDLGPWTLIGLTMVLLSGPLMFSSDPDMYYLNRAFQVKMVTACGDRFPLYGPSQSSALGGLWLREQGSGLYFAGAVDECYFRRNLHRVYLNVHSFVLPVAPIH